MIDGYGCEFKALQDKALMSDIMKKIANNEKMKMLIEPKIVEAFNNDKGDHGGYSGFVIIQESHISIHTFPHVGFVSIDVYTCRGNMNIGQIIDILRLAYSIKDMEVHIQNRGLLYPVL